MKTDVFTAFGPGCPIIKTNGKNIWLMDVAEIILNNENQEREHKITSNSSVSEEHKEPLVYSKIKIKLDLERSMGLTWHSASNISPSLQYTVTQVK